MIIAKSMKDTIEMVVKRNQLEKLLSNDYVLSLCSKACIMLFGFISLIFLNRFLGTELKGEYSSIINIVTIVTTILQLGLSSIYPRFKRRNIENCYEVFISLTIIQLVFYILVSIIIILISGFNGTVIFICLISVVSTVTMQFRYINLVENIKKNTIVVFVASALNCILTVVAYFFLEQNLAVALIIYMINCV